MSEKEKIKELEAKARELKNAAKGKEGPEKRRLMSRAYSHEKEARILSQVARARELRKK